IRLRAQKLALRAIGVLVVVDDDRRIERAMEIRRHDHRIFMGQDLAIDRRQRLDQRLMALGRQSEDIDAGGNLAAARNGCDRHEFSSSDGFVRQYGVPLLPRKPPRLPLVNRNPALLLRLRSGAMDSSGIQTLDDVLLPMPKGMPEEIAEPFVEHVAEK